MPKIANAQDPIISPNMFATIFKQITDHAKQFSSMKPSCTLKQIKVE